MMPSDERSEHGQNPATADRQIWQRCRSMDAAEDETARFLDLAAFADGLLDVEERDRVAALLAADPEAAADVRAARALAASEWTPAGLERIIARAGAISPDKDPGRGNVVPLVPRRSRRLVPVFAQWASLAAAIALAGWLGFAMGSDASLALSDRRSPSDTGLLPELFDPASGFLRDLGEGLRT
jgi:anti-sigma factor RsiW